MTDLDVKILHKIIKNIREPLREKRQKFVEQKNFLSCGFISELWLNYRATKK
jgi:hypothetical protein